MKEQLPTHSSRYYEIDLLRFLAALSVVIYHYAFWGYAADKHIPFNFPDIAPFAQYGYMGVDLFFIISGYVVLLSAKGKTVRQFFLSRVTRLYPAFWVVCTVIFLAKLIWGVPVSDTGLAVPAVNIWKQYAYNMSMFAGHFGIAYMDGPFWTLTVEISFYLLISILIGYNLLRNIDFVLVFWIGLICLPGKGNGTSFFSEVFFPAHAPLFIAGMLFHLLQQERSKYWLRVAMLVAVWLLSLRFGIEHGVVMSKSLHTDFSSTVIVVIQTAFFLLFGLIVTRKISLTWAWLAKLGALTYPLYLLHSYIGFLLLNKLAYIDKYVLLAGVLAFMLVAAWGIHTFIEKRFARPLGAVVEKGLTKLGLLSRLPAN